MTKATVNSCDIYALVADGAMANPQTADGRLIPVIILDCESKKDLETLVNIHKDTPPGDVMSTWGLKRFNSREVYLVLKFFKPLELSFTIKFDSKHNSMLIDGIIHARSVYLQPGKKGDVFSNDINAPKILIEIPKKTTFNKWDSILTKIVRKKLLSEGASRSEVKEAANEYINRRREVWGRRLKVSTQKPVHVAKSQFVVYSQGHDFIACYRPVTEPA